MTRNRLNVIRGFYRVIGGLVLILTVADVVLRWVNGQDEFISTFFRLLYGFFWAAMIFASPKLLSAEWEASLPNYIWQFSPPRILLPFLWGMLVILAIFTFIASLVILAFYYSSNGSIIVSISLIGTGLIMIPLAIGITRVFYRMRPS